VEIQRADTMPDGWRFWRDWHKAAAPDNLTEIEALEADAGSYLGYIRVIGRRSPSAHLEEPIVSAPANYTSAPLLREKESGKPIKKMA
jgi:hypothetical protein